MAGTGSTVRCFIVACGAVAGVAHAAPPPLARPLTMPERAGFEANRGQWPAAVRFVVRDGPATVFLTGNEAVWRPRAARGAQAVRLRWPGAAAPVAGPAAAARVHYLRGGAVGPVQDVPLHQDLTYPDAFPGVDLVFHDRRGALEYDLVVAPGADPAAIRLAVDGATRVALDGDGNLVLDTAGGAIVQRAPVAWQDGASGRDPVAARYALHPGGDTRTVDLTFAVGAWDRTRPLVIDPSVVYATDIDDGTDTVSGVAVDADGNLWLAGTTQNTTFPVTDDAAQAEKNGIEDGYVAKLDAAGELRYATYIGGSSQTCLGGIDIEPDGSLLLAGITIDADFPIAGNAIQPTAAGGGGDAFVARLDPDGRLVHSTYFGGTGAEQCGGRLSRPARIASVPGGGAYLLIGLTTSTELPAEGAARAGLDGDVAVVRFDNGLQPLWGRFLGGTANDMGYEIASTADDGAVVYGHTTRIFGMESNFPTTDGAFQERNDLDTSHFVARYDNGGALLAATLFGPPSGADPLLQPGDIAVAGDGTVVVAVTTGSAGMPATAGAYQRMLRGFSDLFVARLRADLSALVWATYLGGSQAEKIGGIGLAVVTHSDGRVSVGGVTESADYPLQAPLAQVSDQVLSTLAADGASLTFSSRVALGTAALAAGDQSLYVGGQRINRLGVGAVCIDERVVSPTCRGDCDGNGAVQVNELVLGVRIILEEVAVGVCAALDADGNGVVVVSELVAAVGAALAGCG